MERRVSNALRAASTVPISYYEKTITDVTADKVRTPAAPVEITSQSALYTDGVLARQYARLMVDFPDVTHATDGSTIPIGGYELWGRDDTTNFLESTTGAVPGAAAPGLTFPGLASTQANKDAAAASIGDWQLLSTSSTSSLRKDGLIPGSVWTFKVRALGVYTVAPGVFSQEYQIQLGEDTTPPAQPTTPILTVARGTITVKWDGLSVLGSMPGDLSHLIVASSTTSSPTAEIDRFFTGGGVTVISDAEYYKPVFVRFQAVDLAGNKSPWSEQATAFTTPLVDTDVILAEIDGDKTLIKNIAGAALKDGAVLAQKLADNAVTQEKLADNAISTAKLENTVVDSISKGIADAAAAQSTANTASTAAATAQSAADAAKALVADVVASGVNMIQNGNFDLPILSPVTGWPNRTLTYVEANAGARSGANIMRAAPTATIAYAYTDYVASAKDRWYVAEMWVKLNGPAIDTTTDTIGFYFSALSDTGASAVSPVANQEGLRAVSLSETVWTRVSFQYKVTQTGNIKLRVGPRFTGNGNSYLVDDFKLVDVTDRVDALAAAAAAQAKADSAFADAQTALTNAGLAQTAANGKNTIYYGPADTPPAGSGFKVNDVWYRASDNKTYMWDGDSWEPRVDAAIATAQAAASAAQTAANTADGKAVAAQTAANNAQSAADAAQTSANNAASAASTADGKAVAAQTSANNAQTAANNAQTSANNASTLANSVVKTSTSAATGTPPSVGALWVQTNAGGDLVINTWTSNAAGTAWVLRKLDDAVIGNLNAATISAGIINAARYNATDIRAKFIEAGKVTAADMVTGTITAASGIIGSMSASVITTGTLDAARLNAGDVRAAILTAGKITAADMVTGTITAASGIIGSMSASVITTGTLDAARLNAGDVRAAIIAAGKIAAVDMITGTITAASGIIGSLDIGKVTTGTMSGQFITANTLNVKHLKVSDLVNFAPSMAESPEDWELSAGVQIVDTAIAAAYDKKRVTAAGVTSGTVIYARGPYVAVKEGDELYAEGRIYRVGPTTNAISLRYYFYDSAKAFITSGSTTLTSPYPTTATNMANGSDFQCRAVVPAGAMYARLLVVFVNSTGDDFGMYNIRGYKRFGGNLIVDGSVNADKVEATSVAAKLGSFLEIDVSQLNASAASIDTAVIDKLWTDVVNSRKITTEMLVVTGENLLANSYGQFGNNTYWSDWTFDAADKPTTDGRITGSFYIPGAATITKTLANGQGNMPVNGDSWYVFEGYIKASVANSRTYIEFMEDNGVNPSPQYALNNYVVPTVWTPFSIKVKTSVGQKFMTMRMFSNHPNGSVTNATQKIAGLRFRPAVGSDLVVDGSILTTHLGSESVTAAKIKALDITAGQIAANAIVTDKLATGSVTAAKLEATLVLATRVLAGPSSGTHAEMNSTGFQVFAADPLGGAAREVVRLGVAASNDYLAVTNSAGELVTTVDETGTISARKLVTDQLTYKGEDMQVVLDRASLGLVAWGQFNGNQFPATIANGTERGLFEIAWEPVGTRMYAVSCSPVLFTPTSGTATAACFRMRYTTDGTQPTTTSPILSEDFKPILVNGSWTMSFQFADRLIGGFNGSYIRILFSIACSNGAGLNTELGQSPTFSVKDLGPAYPTAGVLSNQVGGGGGGSRPPVVTRKKYYTAVDRRSYLPSDAMYNYDTGRMYQGPSPAGVGQLRSAAFFPDMTADLSGATINDMQVYLYFDHWYNNAGGTARIGLHGYTGATPASWASLVYRGWILDSSGWPKPGGRWLSIPQAYWAGFLSGFYRGITLGVNTSGNEHYGIAQGSPQIYVQYTV
jgi:hypothetical protein